METKTEDFALFESDRAINYDAFVKEWIPNYGYFMSIFPNLLANAPEKTMLTVGCGTGNEMLALKTADRAWSITGVDPSLEMIQIAQKKLASYENIRFFEGEVTQLKSRARYGAASLILVLHFIKYPYKKLSLLRAIQKRLKPGAPFIIMGIFGNKAQLRRNLNVLRAVLPHTLTASEIEERITRITNSLHRTSEEELEKLTVKAGFEKPTRFFQTTIYSAWITKKPTT